MLGAGRAELRLAGVHVAQHDHHHGHDDRGGRQHREDLRAPPRAPRPAGGARSARLPGATGAAPRARRDGGARRPPALVGALLGQLGELRLEPIQIVAHADSVSLSCSRIRASPRLTRLRTTISEHLSWVAISL